MILLLLLLCAFRLKTGPAVRSCVSVCVLRAECLLLLLLRLCHAFPCVVSVLSPVFLTPRVHPFFLLTWFLSSYFSFCVVSGIYQSVLCSMMLQCDRTKSLTPEYSRFGAMILLLLLLHLRHCCCSVAALLHDAAVDVDCCFIASIFMPCCCLSINMFYTTLSRNTRIFIGELNINRVLIFTSHSRAL